MLVLSRSIGENIRIGDDVSVVVLDVKGNQVRLGIAAPKNVAVHREEIYRRIQNEKNGGGQEREPSPQRDNYSHAPRENTGTRPNYGMRDNYNNRDGYNNNNNNNRDYNNRDNYHRDSYSQNSHYTPRDNYGSRNDGYENRGYTPRDNSHNAGGYRGDNNGPGHRDYVREPSRDYAPTRSYDSKYSHPQQQEDANKKSPTIVVKKKKPVSTDYSEEHRTEDELY